MFLRVFTFLLAILTLSFCNQKSAEDIQLDELFDNVMTVHDEVMPKMSNIYKLKKSLKAIEAKTENQQRQISQTLTQLDATDEQMMNWMAEFKKPGYSNFKQAKAYLENQLIMIKDVKANMLASISKGELIIQELSR